MGLGNGQHSGGRGSAPQGRKPRVWEGSPTHLSPPEPYMLPCIMSLSRCGTMSTRWLTLDKTESALALPEALGFALVSEPGISQELEVAIPYP